jgi:hypothetical protein
VLYIILACLIFMDYSGLIIINGCCVALKIIVDYIRARGRLNAMHERVLLSLNHKFLGRPKTKTLLAQIRRKRRQQHISICDVEKGKRKGDARVELELQLFI